MNFNRTFCASALVLSLTACVGGEASVPDCTYPDSPQTAAPGWVCDEPVEGLAVSAVGSANKSAIGYQTNYQ